MVQVALNAEFVTYSSVKFVTHFCIGFLTHCWVEFVPHFVCFQVYNMAQGRFTNCNGKQLCGTCVVRVMQVYIYVLQCMLQCVLQ